MLETYRDAMNPSSLLDVVPKEVLQSMMQGFFYGFRAGALLIFDERNAKTGRHVYKRLEPVDDSGGHGLADQWRDLFNNFNPFCAEFRRDPERNRLCEACDLYWADKVFSGTKKSVRYDCHMGLVDMTIPITMAGKVRGVLFGGQKIIKDDPEKLKDIRLKVIEKAPDIAEQLIPLLEKGSTSDEVKAFENSFQKFSMAMQITVDAFVSARRHEAEQATLLELGQQIARAVVTPNEGCGQLAIQLLSELSSMIGVRGLWLFQRRGSRYRCVATSPSVTVNSSASIPVSSVMAVTLDNVVHVFHGDKIFKCFTEVIEVSSNRLLLIRSDAPAGAADVTSLILAIDGVDLGEYATFVTGIVRALAYPSGVESLIRRLENQQFAFTRKTSFIWHHLKTPIQAALAFLYTARASVSSGALTELIENAEKQITLGLADALRLQDSALTLMKRSEINIIELIERVVKEIMPIASARNIQIEIKIVGKSDQLLHPMQASILRRSWFVDGVELFLKVAFSNLIENAVKYAFESTRIDVFIRPEVTVSNKTGFITIDIVDVGVGFPEDQKEELFNLGMRLDTSKGAYARSGSGVGLVQSKEYIQSAGGLLDIDSHLVPYSQSKYKVSVTSQLPILFRKG